MEHIIRITVIAECSQFGSNMNVIPILAEYPTMRVLMQNILVSVNNVSTVLKTLKDLINTFKKDLGKFRKKLTMKRSKMGYELDVRDDHPQTAEESAESNFSASLESPTKTTNHPGIRKGSIASVKGGAGGNSKVPNNGSSQQARHTRNKSSSSSSKQQVKKSTDTSLTTSGATTAKKSSHHHHHHYNHHRHSSAATTTLSNVAESMKKTTAKDKKDVWGVGKTGSTLSYILRAGLFALNLLSKDGQPSLILISDGVVKSNIQDESVIRQLTAENVACSVVQIGQDRGFFPGLNFGFVPDNEILEFLTTATQGQFMFAENCPPIPGGLGEDMSFFSDPPNIYHHRLLLKEINLDKVNSSRKKKDGNANSGATNDINSDSASSAAAATVAMIQDPHGMIPQHHEHRVFPWDPYSQPIMDDIGICKYKEYFLPTECWHFMRARLRQGFLLYSVALIDEIKAGGIKTTTTNGVKYVGQPSIAEEGENNSNSKNNNNFQKKESVIIVFVLHWQPSITVEYRIKSLWTSSLRHYLRSISLNQDRMVNIPEEPHVYENDNIFSCMRAPRAQIIIKSTASFTHMLSNWDQFQRRNQMMAVQGAKSSIDLTGAPGFIKVGKMKRLLERMSETDGMLKQLVQFNSFEKISSISNSSESISNNKGGRDSSTVDWTSQLNYIQKFSSHWAKLERSELRVFNMCWYDEQQFNLIIGSSLTPYNMKDYRLDGSHTMGAEFDEIQMALNYIYAKLENWSTFMSEDQQVYIKILNVGEAIKNSTKSHPLLVDRKISSSSSNSEMPSRKHTVPRFCEVRVVRETDKVVCIKLMFFNMDIRHRYLITEELQTMLNTQHEQHQTLTSLEIKSPVVNGLGIEQDKDSPVVVTLTRRPLSSLLMRDGVHFLPKATEFENGKLFSVTQQQTTVTTTNNNQNNNNKSLWYINPALVLTGEFIVRNYLLQYTWHWDTRDIIPSEKHAYGRYFAPLLNLAFEHITVTRLEQVYEVFLHAHRETNMTKNTVNFFSVGV